MKQIKPRENPKPFINKIIYKQNQDKDIICAYRYITVKKGNIYLLRCQDKFCKSKAYYNFESKEIAIYQEHSKELKNHILFFSSQIKNLSNYIYQITQMTTSKV